jgi:hypothetical protein
MGDIQHGIELQTGTETGRTGLAAKPYSEYSFDEQKGLLR